MVLKIGITGGIGSGKTIVCRLFKILGVPVFEADAVAKNIINNDPGVRKGLIYLFGSGIYTPEHVIDRKKLASIIFNDKYALQKVNKLVHPKVRNEFTRWVQQQKARYVLHEAAILFESGFDKLMDQNILVVADKEVRIQRVMARDHISREQVLERMSRQWPDERKRKLSDAIIKNNDELLIPQVLRINENIKKYGKVW
ncbi:Dephospho-CoA kinase [hydrothermal vent metagenome]|uniref:Dephospho-CoA kinase n=1 Tax=hydrothermal vent metagenome TaxID=652676 RepID=A0A3B0U370_9ZZZZ